MRTRVPETIACVNCKHNIIIRLYEVDTTINSAQGHFHTVHNSAEPAYTVYCINCGHFMTNDPHPAPSKPGPAPRPPRSNPEKQAISGSGAPRKAAKPEVPERAGGQEPKTAAAAEKPRQKPVPARAKKKANKQPAAKQPRPQRKKAK